MTNLSSARDGLESFALLLSVGKSPPVSESADSVAIALARLRLHEAAELAIRFNAVSPATIRRMAPVAPYVRFIRSMSEAERDYYRASIGGTARAGDLERALIAHGRDLWQRLYANRGAYNPADLRAAVRDQFGTVVSIEGSPSELFLSHVFEEYTTAVQGRATRMIVVDGTVANGIDGWLLDGGGGRAGWIVRDTIFASRAPFIETAFRAWIGLTDPQSIPGELFRITRDSVADIARANADSLGFLPGVAARMFRSGAQQLLDSIRSHPLARDERGAAIEFTRALSGELFYRSINAHEGRHVSDLRAGRVPSGPDAEFRAKLDEVGSARYPRLAMTAILTPRIGDGSSHGDANRRIMLGLTRWIRGNGSAIAGYDPRMPALLQLPLLTDAQLRMAFSSMRGS